MKIAVPTVDGRLCMHFGHCQQFALVNVDEANDNAMETEMVTPPPHEPGLLPRWLHEKDVDVIIAGGMGGRAQQLFGQNGIKVLVGAPAETPEQLVTAYLAGSLQSGANACDH